MPILRVNGIHKSYGTNQLFDGLDAVVYRGEKVGLIGPNGCGKTTLFNIILGQVDPDLGEVVRGKDIRIGLLRQEPLFEGDLTVVEQMHTEFADIRRMQEKMISAADGLASLGGDELERAMVEYERMTRDFELSGGYGYETKMHLVLAALGFGEDDYRLRTSALSGGQKSRLGLAKVLLGDSNLLLLDEPTNHLDLEATIWLEKFLRNYEGAIMIISHDRYLLDRVVTKVVEIEARKAVAWKGNYSDYVTGKQQRRLTEQREYEKRAAMVAKTRDFIDRNRNQKGMTKVARGRSKQLESTLAANPDFLSRAKKQPKLTFRIKSGKSKSELAVRCEGLGKRYGQVRLFADMDFELYRGERLGISGPNGTGKTTLLKVAIGKVEATEGVIRIGENMVIGYLDQQAEQLCAENTVLEEAGRVRADMSPEQLRGRLGSFLFSGEDVFKTVSQLSGGERNRLGLCKLVLTEPDILLLDEPTNHLDIRSCEMLEEALEAYEGTLMVVSHDRYFLDKVASRILMIGADDLGKRCVGRHEFVDGGFSRYAEIISARQERAAANEDRGSSSHAKSKRPRRNIVRQEVPAELKRFNRLGAEQLEQQIMETEAALSELHEQFGNERVYKDGGQIKKLHVEFERKQAELGLLWRAYERRIS